MSSKTSACSKIISSRLVDSQTLFGGYLHKNCITAPVFRCQSVFGQLPFDPIRIRIGFVDFVDRNDNRDIGGAGMINGFNGLRHHAVIGGHHQNDDVGDFGAARPHGRERLMTRRVQKGDLSPFGGDMVGADMLGNAAGFQIGNSGFADNIQQGGFAVIHMSHNGYHRRTLLHFFRIVFDLLL